jgi:hypothetical protein
VASGILAERWWPHVILIPQPDPVAQLWRSDARAFGTARGRRYDPLSLSNMRQDHQGP